jgi:hypothetical protein
MKWMNLMMNRKMKNRSFPDEEGDGGYGLFNRIVVVSR